MTKRKGFCLLLTQEDQNKVFKIISVELNYSSVIERYFKLTVRYGADTKQRTAGILRDKAKENRGSRAAFSKGEKV